ncbi:MAG: DUF5681 domain-containing protein [Phycisphaerales bacterium]
MEPRQDEQPGRGPADHLADHRWAKGVSGNPGGRPRGRSVSGVLRDLLEREHNGRELGELLAELMLKQALKGNLGFVREILDRAEGRVSDREHGGPEGGAVIYNIVEYPARHPVAAEGGADR